MTFAGIFCKAYIVQGSGASELISNRARASLRTEESINCSLTKDSIAASAILYLSTSKKPRKTAR